MVKCQDWIDHLSDFSSSYSNCDSLSLNMFNQLKFYVKRYKPQSAEEVFNGVELASQCISSEECQNYYKNMKKYINLCVQKKPIDNRKPALLFLSWNLTISFLRPGSIWAKVSKAKVISANRYFNLNWFN